MTLTVYRIQNEIANIPQCLHKNIVKSSLQREKILKQLCKWKGVRIIEEAYLDHVHLCLGLRINWKSE